TGVFRLRVARTTLGSPPQQPGDAEDVERDQRDDEPVPARGHGRASLSSPGTSPGTSSSARRAASSKPLRFTGCQAQAQIAMNSSINSNVTNPESMDQ